MRHSRRRQAGFLVFVLPGALLLGAPVGAEEPSAAPRIAAPAEILAQVDGVAAEERSLFASFRISKGHGLDYRHSLMLGQHVVKLRVHGPVQSRKSLGLGFQIRF